MNTAYNLMHPCEVNNLLHSHCIRHLRQCIICYTYGVADTPEFVPFVTLMVNKTPEKATICYTHDVYFTLESVPFVTLMVNKTPEKATICYTHGIYVNL